MLSRVISSLLLSCRASSMTCWLSRTSMPTLCNANIMGGLDDVDAQRCVGNAFGLQDGFDLLGGAAEEAGVRMHRAAQAQQPRPQWSWCSQGACSRWCLAAEPKSQTYGSPLPVSSE